MPKAQFSMRALAKMLKDFSALATTPDGRKMLAEQLESTIRRSNIGGAMLDKVKLMYAFLRDPAEPVKPKLLIGAALLYLVVPNDLIPDWLGLFGFTDDLAAISIVWNQSRDILLNYDDRRRQRITGISEAA